MSEQVRIFTEAEDEEGNVRVMEIVPEASQYVLLEDYENVVRERDVAKHFNAGLLASSKKLREEVGDLKRHNNRYMVNEQHVKVLLKGHMAYNKPGQTISGDLAQKIFNLIIAEPEDKQEQTYSAASPGPKHFEPVAQGSFSGTAFMYPLSDDGKIIRDDESEIDEEGY